MAKDAVKKGDKFGELVVRRPVVLFENEQPVQVSAFAGTVAATVPPEEIKRLVLAMAQVAHGQPDPQMEAAFQEFCKQMNARPPPGLSAPAAKSSHGT